MPCAAPQTHRETPVLPSAQPAAVEFTYWYLLSIPALFLFLSLFKLTLEVFISQKNPYSRYLYQKDLVMVGLRGQHVWSGSALGQALPQLTYISRSITMWNFTSLSSSLWPKQIHYVWTGDQIFDETQKIWNLMLFTLQNYKTTCVAVIYQCLSYKCDKKKKITLI